MPMLKKGSIKVVTFTAARETPRVQHGSLSQSVSNIGADYRQAVVNEETSSLSSRRLCASKLRKLAAFPSDDLKNRV